VRTLWLATLLSLIFFALPAHSHEGRPVNVQLREREPGLFLVQWQVPKALPIEAMPSPVLPEPCDEEGERVVLDQPASWLNRQLYRCPEGLAGKTMEIHYPLHNPSLTTLVRVEFLTGERYAHVLGPAERSWRIPGLGAADVGASLRLARDAVLGGVRHVFQNLIHLVFLIAVCLMGVQHAFRFVTAFSLGQLVAVPVAVGIGVRVDPAAAEIAVAVAALLLAREAMNPRQEWRQLAVIVAGAGVLHGMGVAALVSPDPISSRIVWQGLVQAVVGMDAAILILVLVLGAAGRLPVRSMRSATPRRALAYGVGGSAFALALVFATAEQAGDVTARQAAVRLPGIVSPSAIDPLPGSRRVAPRRPEAGIESYLAIEPFEVRHEVLIRLGALTDLVGVDSGEGNYLEIEDQELISGRLGEMVAASSSVQIDGEVADGIVERLDFMTVGEQGALPRPAPVREEVDEAVVGVTITYLTADTPEEVIMAWESFPEPVISIPATVTDPEASLSTTLTATAPSVRWENELVDDPIPTVSEVNVEPAKLAMPLLSLPLFALSALLAIAALRRRRPMVSFTLARILLALGLVVGPWADIAIPVPSRAGSAPSQGEAKRILAGILPNVYRALEFRDESAAYDRLAVSVTGETLTEVYLDHRRALEMEERGGARARVEAVEVLDVAEVHARDDGGFDARASWTVGGTVTHFGHRHFRQNRYDARVAVLPVEGNWKIRSIKVVEQERVR
jgi:hypothetical protein